MLCFRFYGPNPTTQISFVPAVNTLSPSTRNPADSASHGQAPEGGAKIAPEWSYRAIRSLLPKTKAPGAFSVRRRLLLYALLFGSVL
jgi:hypothetical protein